MISEILNNVEQFLEVDIWIYTYSSAVYFVLFHRLVVIDDNLALAATTMFLIAFFDREKTAFDNIYFLLSLYITQITWIV